MPNLVFAPVEAIQAPRTGDTICDSWWIHSPGKGVAFHKSDWGLDPQCNQSRQVAEIVHRRLYADHELLFVPVAYLGHDDGASLCHTR